MVCCVFLIFFFKQKTAYEMRISDWSSDVCSSDLRDQIRGICDAVVELSSEGSGDILVFLSGEREIRDTADALTRMNLRNTELLPLYARQIGRASCRERVCQYV